MALRTRLQDGFVAFHQAAYQRTGGWLGHRLIGVPTLLLRTTGRRSGLPRVAPLVYARDGAAWVVVASNDGRDTPPAWLLNVAAHPEVEVRVGRRTAAARARIVEPGDPEHGRLWALVNRVNRGRYEGYQRRTERPIALAVLEPAGS